MKTGIIITGYDRYPLLLTSLMSLSSCHWKNTRFVYVDDCSPDPKVKECFEGFAGYERERGNEAEMMRMTEHLGLPGLSVLKRNGLAMCDGCDVVVFVPDDVIYNPFFAESVIVARKWLDKFPVLTFMEDTRGPLFGLDCAPSRFDGYHLTPSVDGFGVMMTYKFAKSLDWTVNMEEARNTGRSLLWRTISHQCKGRMIATDEGLMEHIGNFYNATMKKEKADSKKIYAVNPNVYNKPSFLG